MEARRMDLGGGTLQSTKSVYTLTGELTPGTRMSGLAESKRYTG